MAPAIRSRLCGLGLALLLVGAAARAQAEDTYEWKRTQQLLDDSGLRVAPAPEGKRIAWVRVVRDNIFVEGELWPRWLNWFHKLTKDRVVRRELLLEPGDAYDDTLVEETMRNLRSMGIFALVRIVAVETDRPGEVGLLVHTRDVWSLRLEQQLSIDRQINLLHLVLIERNVAGLNNDLSGTFTLTPDKYTLAQSYVARRFAGSRIRVEQYQGLILGRLRPGSEGSLGGLSVSQPFYRLSQRVSWSVSGGYDARVARQLDASGRVALWEADDGRTANTVFSDRSGFASGIAAYRFGDEVKIALGGGLSYRERRTRPTAETGLADDLLAAFREDVLPLSRRDLGPRIYYEMFTARYRTLVNLSTYGQSENVRVGPRVYLSLHVPVEALGSTADALVFAGLLEHTVSRGKGLLNVNVQTFSRLQAGTLLDQRLLAQLRFATPVLGPVPFRLVSRIALDARARDSQRTFVTLGSDRGLRGYAARSFGGRGASRFLANVELRSLPIKLRSLHLGGVVFYDVGSVYARLSQATLHHAVGCGVRFEFPQFNRYPFSFDVGFPVDPETPLQPATITPTLNTAQSVPLTELEEDSFP